MIEASTYEIDEFEREAAKMADPLTQHPPEVILPMGGGYDWRCYLRDHGSHFLCKDGVPLRDTSRWNKEGWRACAVEMGDQRPIEKFAEYVASLEGLLTAAETFRISRDIAIKKRGDDKWCISNGTACLNTDNEWESEPSPSNRDEDFIARTRFTREEAFRRARAHLDNPDSADL